MDSEKAKKDLGDLTFDEFYRRYPTATYGMPVAQRLAIQEAARVRGMSASSLVRVVMGAWLETAVKG